MGRVIMIGLALLFGTGAVGRDVRVQLSAIPKNVMDVVMKEVSGFRASSASFEVESNKKVYEIEGAINGEQCEVSVEEDGTVQEVKTAASASALPPGVQSAIKDKYPLFQSSLVEKSRRPDGTYYEIEGSDGTSRWELEIMDDGSHLEAKRLGQGD